MGNSKSGMFRGCEGGSYKDENKLEKNINEEEWEKIVELAKSHIDL